jgi:NAD(P)-dependent dehydrogenase (short-subunit alcohol dehydrogenase family)
VNFMTMSNAPQNAAEGIRCSTIAPGFFSTPMVQVANKHNYAGLADMIRSRNGSVPKRWKDEGWDVGEAAAFLASDDARFIIGQVLAVDGGSTSVVPSEPCQPAAGAHA